LAQPKRVPNAGDMETFADSRELKRYITQFQQDVDSYLKGSISVLVSASFDFPGELASVYRSGLSSLYLWGNGDHEAIRFSEDHDVRLREPVWDVTQAFAKPPSLLHLLETRQWDAARDKIEQVFAELETVFIGQTALYEIFLSVANAYMYLAHKQGHTIHQLDQAGWDPLYIQQVVQSAAKLRSWSLDMLNKLHDISSEQETTSKSHIIKQVQEMVTADSGHDLSVKTIADRVFLHPVYLSKIYKSETGEGLGDYIIRKRMERALYLLKHTNKKIYEITAELGYQNPQYFSKMFRKHYGMTPNEYRDQGCC
jgi:two-component system, response regulator YesN